MNKNFLIRIVIFPLLLFFGCNSSIEEKDNNTKIYQESSEEEQLDSVFHYVRGHRYLELNNLSAAESRFKKVIELEPKFARGWLGLANSNYLANQIDEANNNNNKALNLKPDLEEALYLQGLIYKQEGKCSKFLKDKKPKEFYSYDPLILMLGLCNGLEGQNQKALEIFSYKKIKSIELNIILAEYEFYLGNFSESIKYINKYIEENENPKGYILKGKILVASDKKDEAISNFKEAMDLSKDPKIPLFYVEASSLYKELDNN